MYVNNIHISEYGAELEYGYKVSGASIETKYSSYGQFPRLHDQRAGAKKIEATLTFSAESSEEAYGKYSELCKILTGNLEIVMPDRAMYSAFLTDIGEEEYITEGCMDVSFSFVGVKHGPLQTVTGNRLICMSTLPKTDCKLTVTVGASGSNYKLGTMNFPVVTAGEVFCVDGITKRILVDGVPAAQRAEWTQFPYLVPGENTIECADPVTVEYYPGYF